MLHGLTLSLLGISHWHIPTKVCQNTCRDIHPVVAYNIPELETIQIPISGKLLKNTLKFFMQLLNKIRKEL